MHQEAAPSSLHATLQEELKRYFEHLAGRVQKALFAIPEEHVWTRPFPFGNSLGHLVLHLTGNLNHYIGAGIARTGYVRNRTREFTDPNWYPRSELWQGFRQAVDMVLETLDRQRPKDWLHPVDFPDRHPIRTRLGLFLVCASHMNNHIGQMAYLVQALGQHTGEPPVW